MLHYEISAQINAKPEDVLKMPIVVRVSEFTDESVGKFRESVNEAMSTDQPIVPIIVDSYGGSVYGLMAMIDVVEMLKETHGVATIVDGKAMSAGAVLASSGTPGLRFIGPSATIMVHQVSAHTSGKIAEMDVDTKVFAADNRKLLGKLDKYCGQQRGFFHKAIKDRGNTDWFLNPREAVKLGMADHIRLPKYGVHVDVKYSFG